MAGWVGGVLSGLASYIPFIAYRTTIPEQLQKVLKSFAVEFFQQLNWTFHTLHQRSCRKASIATQHPLTCKELEKLDAKMTSVWKEAIKLYDEIPNLADSEDKISALSCVLHLETVAFQLTEQCRKLQLILKSTCHQEALKYYKELVKECESFAGKEVEEGKLGVLFDNITVARRAAEVSSQDQEPCVQDEITLLYDEMVEYLSYTGSILRRDDLKGKIADAQNIAAPLEEDPEKAFLRDISAVKLPTENYFRNGQWLTGWRYVGYPDIRSEVTALEDIAKALYRIEELQKTRLERVCSAAIELEAYKTELSGDLNSLQDLKMRIGELRTALTKKPLLNQNHAGWCYAAGLDAQKRHVEASIKELQSIEFLAYAKSVGEFKCCVQASQDQNPQKAIWHLYQAKQAEQQVKELSKAYERVYKVIHDTLEKEAVAILTLNSDETAIATKIFARTYFVSEGQFENYLAKSFVHALYFSQGTFNPELEALLVRIESDPLYKEAFAKCQQIHPWLQQVYLEYQVRSGIGAANETLTTMTKALAALHELNLQDSEGVLYARFVYYHKARQRLRTLEAQAVADPAEQSRLGWFKVQLEQQFSERWQPALDLSKSLKTQKIYKCLRMRLFGIDPAKRKAADAAILQLLASKGFTMPDDVTILHVLLGRWALERFVGEKDTKKSVLARLADMSLEDRSDAEMNFISQLFSVYLSNPVWTNIWRSQYGIGYMELALQKFYNKIKSTNCAFKMRLEDWPILDQLLLCYAEFRNHLGQDHFLIRDTPAYRSCYEIYTKAQHHLQGRNADKKTNLQIAFTLLNEMKEFLYDCRVSYVR